MTHARPGEAVVEADREAERGDRVAEHVLRRVERHDEDRPDDRHGAHPDRREARRQVARMDVREAARDRPLARHRERRARGRQDRRLRRGRRRRQHGEDQQLVPAASRTPCAPSTLSTSSELSLEQSRAAVRLRGGRDDEVDQHEQDRRDDRRAARPLVAVLGLLVDGDAGVPAPVDEDAEQHAVDQRAPAEVERVEPRQLRRDRVGRVARRRPSRARRRRTARGSRPRRDSSTVCMRADSSMPRQQIHVISAIQTTAIDDLRAVRVGGRVPAERAGTCTSPRSARAPPSR